MISTPDSTVARPSQLARLARAGAERRRWRTVGAWFVIVVALLAADATFGVGLVSHTIHGSETRADTDLREQRLPEVADEQGAGGWFRFL